MKLEEATKDFLVECEIRRYTPKTLRGYRTNLNVFIRVCEEELGVADIESVTVATVRQFTQVMTRRGRKGTYVNGLLKTLKSYIQYCFDEGYGGFNTKLKSFKWVKEETPVIKAFKPKDVRLMLDNCRGNDFMSIRDTCVLTMLFETGIRCWEMCCIRPEDVRDEYILIVAGKNHKERVVPITAPLKKAIMRYDRMKENYFAYRHMDEFYFLSFHGRQLTNSAVEHIFKRRGEGIEDVRVSPHTARHFFAVQSLKNGMDLYQLSRQLGHNSIAITSTYLRTLQDEDIVKAGKNRSVLMNM